MNNTVPVLITCDIDPTPEVTIADKQKALDLTLDLFDNFMIKATFFTVADVISHYPDQVRQLLNQEHEIGCHGLSHDLEEDYSQMPLTVQRENLTRATAKLEDTTGNEIRSFRGPMVKTSHITQKVLEELDYYVDSSVCSQRMDLISSNHINPGWLFAPRLPYRPSDKSAFKRGERNLVVVPVSALILPFISGVLYTLGTTLMKRLFDTLYFESKQNGKPIVYLMHPVEFAHHNNSKQRIAMKGLSFRRKLKLKIDEYKRYTYSKTLFEYISSFQDVQFMTMSSYIDRKSVV